MQIAQLEKALSGAIRPHIFTVSVQRSGEPVFDWAKSGYKNKVRNLRSVTKSVLSTLYGMALYQGHFKSLDEKALAYLPEFRSKAIDPKFEDITLRHLLTMTSGVDCTDRRPKGFFASKNWAWHFLERPVVQKPGEKFNYSSASSHLLSVILSKMTGLNVYDYAKTYLFHPLAIEKTQWPHDKQGHYCGGFGLALAPGDLLKLGQLYLAGGCFNGQRLLSEDYINEATSFQLQGGFPEQDGYGYHWWVGDSNSVDYYYAAGLGGQYLFVVPEFELLMAITSDSRRPHIDNKKLFTEIVLPTLCGAQRALF